MQQIRSVARQAANTRTTNRGPASRKQRATRSAGLLAAAAFVLMGQSPANASTAAGTTTDGSALESRDAPSRQAEPDFEARLLRAHRRTGQTAAVIGRVGRSGERYTLSVEISRVRGRWRRVATASRAHSGGFKLKWRTRRLGRYRVRVIGRAAGARGTTVRLIDSMTVYGVGHASWYGPGLYGNRTACGQRLSSSIVGVAHKTLRCGTRVALRYHGRTVTAHVIDRGPFIAGRDWDLTAATRHRLRFPSTGAVLAAY